MTAADLAARALAEEELDFDLLDDEETEAMEREEDHRSTRAVTQIEALTRAALRRVGLSVLEDGDEGVKVYLENREVNVEIEPSGEGIEISALHALATSGLAEDGMRIAHGNDRYGLRVSFRAAAGIEQAH